LGYEGCFLAGLKQLPIGGRGVSSVQDSVRHFFRGGATDVRRDITKEFERRRKPYWLLHRSFAGQSEAKSNVFLAIDRLEEEMNQLARIMDR